MVLIILKTYIGQPMEQEIRNHLENAQDALEQLTKSVDHLTFNYPEMLNHKEIENYLNLFHKTCEDAKDKLKFPTLSIATIGTTSAGKSTIVNALIGRRIAPMDAGELSGGVLTIRNHQNNRIVIEETENASWDIGEWKDILDEDAYMRIRGVMQSYQETRKIRDCAAPQILSEGLILPMNDKSLLNLPQNLNIEFIDLPGLKSIQDKTNLAVIQERVNKAFSIVALDYLETDELKCQKLLEELKSVVKYLGGSTDSMIFVLNRVDNRGKEDEPIEQRIELLKTEICQTLGLREPPNIIPFEARLLYYIQYACGPSSYFTQSEDLTKINQQLDSLFQDCASSIERKINDNEDIEDWIQILKKKARKNQYISVNDLNQLLLYIREWSGASALWDCLKNRIDMSFAKLVISPILFEVFQSYEKVISLFQAISRFKKMENQNQLQHEKKRLKQLKEELYISIESERGNISQKLKGSINKLKTKDQKSRHEVTIELGEGFEVLLKAIDVVTGDIMTSLVVPVRDALKNNSPTHMLEAKIGDKIGQPLLKNLSMNYDSFSRRLPYLERKGKYFYIKNKITDYKEISKMLEVEKDMRKLYQSMRNSIKKRAEFMLQAHSSDIKNALITLLNKHKETILSRLKNELPDLVFDKTFEVNEHTDIILPQNLFDLSENIQQKTTVQTEVVGQKETTNESGSCFKSEHKEIQDIYSNIQYKELILPNEDEMAIQWSAGLRKGEDSLWDILTEWMINLIQDISNKFQSYTNTILEAVESSIQEQIMMVKSDYDLMVQKWKNVDQEIKQIKQNYKQLELIVRS